MGEEAGGESGVLGKREEAQRREEEEAEKCEAQEFRERGKVFLSTHPAENPKPPTLPKPIFRNLKP